MNMSTMMEQYSRAYVKAVASVAGVAVDRPSIDDDSVDVMMYRRSVASKRRSPRLDAQLKCTAQDVLKGDVVKFPLPLKNYEDLIPENLCVPRILIVVLVPPEPSDWLTQCEEDMAIRHCGYWTSLRGYPASPNAATVTVEIPRSRVFTVAGLEDIMRGIEEGTFK